MVAVEVTPPRRRSAAVRVVLGWVLPIVLVLAVVQLWVYRNGTIPGLAQRPASDMQELAGLPDLRARFAQDTGHTRLVLLISPT